MHSSPFLCKCKIRVAWASWHHLCLFSLIIYFCLTADKYHKVHHEYKQNNVLKAQYFHPVDFLFSVAGSTLVSTIIVRPHSITQMQAGLWMVTANLDDHIGYSFPWSGVRCKFHLFFGDQIAPVPTPYTILIYGTAHNDTYGFHCEYRLWIIWCKEMFIMLSNLHLVSFNSSAGTNSHEFHHR